MNSGRDNATIFSSDVNFDVEGNAMSMLYDDNFEDEEFDSGSTYHLTGLFYSATTLVNASGMSLPATTVYENSYNDMFNECSGLTSTPQLPATTIGASSYKRMFRDCRVLAMVPELPSTALAKECYASMFQGCRSLTTVPSNYLPVTTLAEGCYRNMFFGCTSLTIAPSLPATALADNCYLYMFYNCTSLTTAPSLPATTLAYGCYQYMFQNCSSLNRIECNADTYYSSSTAATGYWVVGVAASGKFIKNSSNTWWTTGVNGIPTGWTVGTLPAERRDWVKADVSDYVCVGYDKHYKEYIEDTTDGGITWAIVTPVTSRTSEDVIEYNSTDCGYVPPVGNYFKITSLAANNTITLRNNSGLSSGSTFSYSTDNGQTWSSFSLTTGQTKTIATLASGDTLMMYGTNTTLGKSYNAGHYFRGSADYEVSGEISSLVNGSDLTDTEIGSAATRNFTFAQLFSGDTHLVSAENLKISSTALPQSCFNSTFRSCTKLVKAPELPSTILGKEAYSSMFEGCIGLAYPPSQLYFTSIQSDSFNRRMFCMSRSSKLTTPAMTYTPKLFGDWGSRSPVQQQMFCGNGNLTNIYCYWTNASGSFGNFSGALTNWVNYTADSGVTFYKRSTQSFASGVNGIKTGWTVVNDDTTQPT